MPDDQKPNSFWSSIPGILTGIATLVTAVGGLMFTLKPPLRAAKPADVPPPPATASVTPKSSLSALSEQYPGANTSRAFPLQAVIDDPDGYTNIRSMPSPISQIVTQVREGQVFFTRQQDGKWWQVRTKEGKTGYMYVSRIKLLPALNH